MYDQNQFNNGQFNQESGAYHYSFVPLQDEPQTNPTSEPVPPQPPRKKVSLPEFCPAVRAL